MKLEKSLKQAICKKVLFSIITFFAFSFVTSVSASSLICSYFGGPDTNKITATISFTCNTECSFSSIDGKESAYTKLTIIATDELKRKTYTACPNILYLQYGGNYWSIGATSSNDGTVTLQSSSGDFSADGNSTTEPTNPGGNKYEGVVTCEQNGLYNIKECGCIPAEIADITSKTYFLLRIIGPVLLIIIGGFEMAKAVVSQDEKSIKKAETKLVNKFIAAASIFLILTIISFGISIVDDPSEEMKCINTLLDGYNV